MDSGTRLITYMAYSIDVTNCSNGAYRHKNGIGVKDYFATKAGDLPFSSPVYVVTTEDHDP